MLCYGTKGLFCPIVEMHCLLLKYTQELEGACMNHKYLHAVNGWTKELDWLTWENVFSHEKQCFVLQSIFNFISSIANLKSQCPLGLTLSGPQSSRRPGGTEAFSPRNSQRATRNRSVSDPANLSGLRSLLRPDPGWRLEPASSDPGKALPNQ